MSDAQKIFLHSHHPRNWRDHHYVYPVISRRSGGLSIGINLNPDKACNFDCVYCQVDRRTPPRVREVDPHRLDEELRHLVVKAQEGSLFQEPPFSGVPTPLRRIHDIAFSGDGEPTTSKHFRACVEIAAAVRREHKLDDAKLVLITDACYLTKPDVEAGLAVLDKNHGEIWAKLDAGTEAYYRRVNRPNVPLQHVVKNIIAASRRRAVVIQSLFMKLDGAPPSRAELLAYTDRLNDILHAGGRIRTVQVYTIARQPAEDFVTALSPPEVDQIAALVQQRTSLPAEPYYDR